MEAVVVKAICYHNTKITLPYWAPNSRLNEECPLGFAYEDGDFYVHMYGMGEGSYTISLGNVQIKNLRKRFQNVLKMICMYKEMNMTVLLIKNF